LAIVEKMRREYSGLAGYFHWSLLDNYEWLEGFNAKFGLIEVDHNNNLTRLIKPSGYFYRDYINENL
jgi:beta-glucosidase/6-phospho-beta-glucosidase/beta-galactosidase